MNFSLKTEFESVEHLKSLKSNPNMFGPNTKLDANVVNKSKILFVSECHASGFI